MTKEAITAKGAPAPVAPYSQAIRSSGLVFCSGVLGMDPESGQLVDGLAAQVQQAFENLKAVLDAAGLTLEHVVKATVYLKDMADFAEMNDLYGGYFPGTPPARTTVAVRELPKAALFELDAIASS